MHPTPFPAMNVPIVLVQKGQELRHVVGPATISEKPCAPEGARWATRGGASSVARWPRLFVYLCAQP